MVWRRLASLFTFQSNVLGRFSQGRMTEIELGAHTIRSHGATLAKEHMHDWLILLLLLVIEIILFLIHPFYRFVGRDMMTDFMYPMKGNTVPVWSVPLYSVLLPITVFLIFYLRSRDVYDLHHSILGLLFSVLITAIVTDAIKDATGRPRPDFFWRCFPDGKATYDSVTGGVICHGDLNVINEGHKSFPSGHTSWSFAGLGFLSLYLSGKIKVFDRRGHIAKLCIVVLPLLMASLVGISRVDDYWHHWQDVFAGGFIGFVIAVFCYLQFFPAPYHEDGWAPHAYHRAMEVSHCNTVPNQPVTTLSTQRAEVPVVNHERRQENANLMPPLAISPYDQHSPYSDLESGRR